MNIKKRTFLISALFILLSHNELRAQCSFTPTVNPNNLKLCPSETDTIWTQVYDSYQWYKDGFAITGETRQFLIVEQYQDAGSKFKVQATLNNCTAFSAEVLVDGWVFMLPYVASASNGWISGMGDNEICKGDTLFLELGPSVYNTNIQWYKDGIVISGANSSFLDATEAGSYSVTASTGICPNFSSSPGVDIVLKVNEIQKPTIMDRQDSLFALYNGGPVDFQWYVNGIKIPGASNSFYAPSVYGQIYTVTASVNGGYCANESEPFTAIYNNIFEKDTKQQLSIFPNPANDFINIEIPDLIEGFSAEFQDVYGRVVFSQYRSKQVEPISVQNLTNGVYILIIKQHGKYITRQKFIKN
jgi:hypothetical protein